MGKQCPGVVDPRHCVWAAAQTTDPRYRTNKQSSWAQLCEDIGDKRKQERMKPGSGSLEKSDYSNKDQQQQHSTLQRRKRLVRYKGYLLEGKGACTYLRLQ